MRVCGADISGKTVNLVVLEKLADGTVSHIPLVPKIALMDGKDQGSVRAFVDAFGAFIRVNAIGKVAIKARAGKGQFAGGAEGFKIEGLIQANQEVEVAFISPVAIASHEKKHPAPTIEIFAYQMDAFKTARCALKAQ